MPVVQEFYGDANSGAKGFGRATTILGGIVAGVEGEGLGASEIAVLTKAQRLEIVFQRVSSAPSATTAAEAIEQMHGTLDAVENVFSGVPKEESPGRVATPRMYPPQADSMVTNTDGTITATSRGHITIYGSNGSITVVDRSTGKIVFQKSGGG